MNLLHHAKYGKYAGSIHNISLLKFNCIYWTSEQQQIYVARCRKNPHDIMALDATGGISKRDSKHDPHVILYQCMLVTEEGSVPVFLNGVRRPKIFTDSEFPQINFVKKCTPSSYSCV